MSARALIWSGFIATVLAILTTIPPGSGRDLALAATLAAAALIGGLFEIVRTLRHQRHSESAQPRLAGRVALASYFLGRDGRAWTPAEIDATRHALDRAASWLTREAAAWGIALHVERAPIEVVVVDHSPRPAHPLAEDAQEHFDQISDAAEWREILRAATAGARQASYPDLPSLIESLSSQSDASSVVWFLHSLSRGQSFALQDQHTGVPGLRLAVCYAREGTPHGPHAGPIFADPITYLHELLHLFGATDKYGRSTRHFPRGEVTPRDIMFLGHESLARLRIDPLTAREIGWLGNNPPPPAIQQRTRRSGGNRNGGPTVANPD